MFLSLSLCIYVYVYVYVHVYVYVCIYAAVSRAGGPPQYAGTLGSIWPKGGTLIQKQFVHGKT